MRPVPGHGGRAPGVFLLHFTRTILGVHWDAPTATLTVAPFISWKRLRCTHLRIGSLTLDLEYANTVDHADVTLRHNQKSLRELILRFRLPNGATRWSLRSNSADCRLRRGPPCFGKPTAEVRFEDLSVSGASVALG